MSLDRARAAAQAAMGKTDEPTVILDVGELVGITDHFVITGGRNDRQVKAVVDEVARALHAPGAQDARRIEGLSDATWVLMDYGDIVVHVFSAEAREFYDLERLWSDAPKVEVDLPGTLAATPAGS